MRRGGVEIGTFEIHLQALLVSRNRVDEGISAAELTEHCYPVDIPAATASWRLSLLQSSTLPDEYLATVSQPTLLLVAGQDGINPSLEEGARLLRLLPNANRLVFPDSGHTLLLEDELDLSEAMASHGFAVPLPPGEEETAVAAPIQFQRARPFPCSDEDMDNLGRVIGMWKGLTSPHIMGVRNLPDPMATVGR